MSHGARPLRSTRRLQNLQATLPKWYSITNSAGAGQPTLISIYDEIGLFGVSAGSFLADLAGVKGDIECHINSPGGDIFDGIAIYNQLKARKGSVKMVIDGLAASAASFIAQAASPGMLEVAPHGTVMIHEGFAMCIGNAADFTETAALLNKASANIAGIYADRTGKPVDFWREQMQAETWYSDQEAVDAGLADKISGTDTPQDAWDLSVYGRAAPDTAPPAPPAAASAAADAAAAPDVPVIVNAAGNNGWVQRDGKWVFDPDGDGDNDGTAEGDTDHEYWSADGKQLKAIPPDPDGKQGKPLEGDEGEGGKKPFPGASEPFKKDNRAAFPILYDAVDESPWDASKAWSAGAAADDPAAFYRGICAGRRTGDPSTQAAWALPYKYTPSSAVNAAGVRAALGRLSQTQGLTNAAEAKATLTKAMKQVNPDWEPNGKVDPVVLQSALPMPGAIVDDSDWDPAVAWAAGAQAEDPEAFYAGICAGRRPGNPASQEAWALPYRYTPSSPPNAQGVRNCLARLTQTRRLTNSVQARELLEQEMKKITPSGDPDDVFDAELLSVAFANGLEGASR